MNIYEELNIDKKASKDDIKKQHKEYVKSNHPDIGGDTNEFADKNSKYLILLDDGKREQYDKTGKTSEEDINNKLYVSCLAVFNILVNSNCEDLEKGIEDIIMNNISQFMIMRDKQQASINKVKKFLKKVIPKDDKPNPVLLRMDGIIDQHQSVVNKAKEQIEMQEKTREYLKKHFHFENNEFFEIGGTFA